MGLHVHMDKVFQDNAVKSGVQRKNKFIINTGNNMTSEEKENRIKKNKVKYGLSKAEIECLKLPNFKHRSQKKSENVLTLD